VATAPLALGGCGINDIPAKQETAKEKWADVQADYQRRADLIPTWSPPSAPTPSRSARC